MQFKFRVVQWCFFACLSCCWCFGSNSSNTNTNQICCQKSDKVTFGGDASNCILVEFSHGCDFPTAKPNKALGLRDIIVWNGMKPYELVKKGLYFCNETLGKPRGCCWRGWFEGRFPWYLQDTNLWEDEDFAKIWGFPSMGVPQKCWLVYKGESQSRMDDN